MVAAQKVERSGANRNAGRAFEVGRQRLGCRRSGLDGDHAGKAGRKPPGKEAHTGEEIPGQRTSRPAVTRSTSASTSQRFTWKNAPWSTR